MLLPEKRPGKTRKSLSVEQVKDLVLEAIPAGPRPAMWLTALMCGLRPGELAGLRWPYVDIDTDSPSIHVVERALEVEDRYIGQAVPKTPRSKRRIGLHPLLVAALRRHREDMRALELYDDEGFVFCSRNGTPMTMSNMRRAFQLLCRSRLRLGLDDLRAAPLLRLISLVADQLDDLVKVADLAGRGHPHDRGLPTLRPALYPHAIVTWEQLLAKGQG